MLAKDDREYTAWHVEAWMRNLEILDRLWMWAKKNLSTDDFNNKFFGQKLNKRTVLPYTSLLGNIQVLERMWKWVKKTSTFKHTA